MKQKIRNIVKASLICAAAFGAAPSFGYDVFVGGFKFQEQLLDRDKWSFVADHAEGYFNHPNGLQKLPLETRKKIADNFKNKSVFIEQNGTYLTQSWADPADPKKPDAESLVAAGFKPYGVFRVGGGTLESVQASAKAYADKGYTHMYLFDGISAGIKTKKGWLDERNDFIRTNASDPAIEGIGVDEPVNLYFGYNGKWAQSTKDAIKWAHDHSKKYMFLISPNAAGEKFLELSQKLVRDLESSGQRPDVYGVEYYRAGYNVTPEGGGDPVTKNYDMTPETVKDSAGKDVPANTVTGIAYWLLKHRDGAPGFADLWMRDSQQQALGVGMTSEAGQVTLPAGVNELAYTINITSQDKAIDYAPVVQAKIANADGWNVAFSQNGRSISSDVENSGYAFVGDQALMPGETRQITLTLRRTANAGPLDMTLQLRAHPDSTVVRDAIRLTSASELTSLVGMRK